MSQKRYSEEKVRFCSDSARISLVYQRLRFPSEKPPHALGIRAVWGR